MPRGCEQPPYGIIPGPATAPFAFAPLGASDSSPGPRRSRGVPPWVSDGVDGAKPRKGRNRSTRRVVASNHPTARRLARRNRQRRPRSSATAGLSSRVIFGVVGTFARCDFLPANTAFSEPGGNCCTSQRCARRRATGSTRYPCGTATELHIRGGRVLFSCTHAPATRSPPLPGTRVQRPRQRND